MPRDSAKSLEKVDPLLREKMLLALSNPGATVVVAEDLSIKASEAMMHQLRAIKRGFLEFEPRESERYLAAQNKRLHFNREWARDKPGLRTVTIWYAGRIMRPSEEAEIWMRNLINNRQSSQQ